MIQSYKADLSALQDKQSRLLDAYLEGIISKEYYTSRKEQFLREQTRLKSRIKQLERGRVDKLEPILDFFMQSLQAKDIAFSENLHDLREFHDRINSNLYFRNPCCPPEQIGNRDKERNHFSKQSERLILFGGDVSRRSPTKTEAASARKKRQ